MAGQIHPGNLFNLRPDLKALMLLGKLRVRNAETIFGAIADELAAAGVTLLPATTHMEQYLARPGRDRGRQALAPRRGGCALRLRTSPRR